MATSTSVASSIELFNRHGKRLYRDGTWNDLESDEPGFALPLISHEPGPWKIWNALACFTIVSESEESLRPAYVTRFGPDYELELTRDPKDIPLTRWTPKQPAIWVLSDNTWEAMGGLGAGKVDFQSETAPLDASRLRAETHAGVTVVRPLWRAQESSLYPLAHLRPNSNKSISPLSLAEWLNHNNRSDSESTELRAASRFALRHDLALPQTPADFATLRFLGGRPKPLEPEGWKPIANLNSTMKFRLEEALRMDHDDGSLLIAIASGSLNAAQFRVVPGSDSRTFFEDGLRFTGWRGSPKSSISLEAAASYVGQYLAGLPKMPTRESIEAKMRIATHHHETLNVEAKLPNSPIWQASARIGPRSPKDSEFKPFSSLPEADRQAFWLQTMRIMRAEIRRKSGA